MSVGGAARSEDVSKLLRQPIRLNGSSRDIRALSSNVLAKFGYSVGADDRLHGLLVQALAEGQSGAYIYALLNSVLTRGDFRAPSRIDDVMGPFQYGCFASRKSWLFSTTTKLAVRLFAPSITLHFAQPRCGAFKLERSFAF